MTDPTSRDDTPEDRTDQVRAELAVWVGRLTRVTRDLQHLTEEIRRAS